VVGFIIRANCDYGIRVFASHFIEIDFLRAGVRETVRIAVIVKQSRSLGVSSSIVNVSSFAAGGR
jgi:hypothetical protein